MQGLSIGASRAGVEAQGTTSRETIDAACARLTVLQAAALRRSGFVHLQGDTAGCAICGLYEKIFREADAAMSLVISTTPVPASLFSSRDRWARGPVEPPTEPLPSGSTTKRGLYVDTGFGVDSRVMPGRGQVGMRRCEAPEVQQLVHRSQSRRDGSVSSAWGQRQ